MTTEIYSHLMQKFSSLKIQIYQFQIYCKYRPISVTSVKNLPANAGFDPWVGKSP